MPYFYKEYRIKIPQFLQGDGWKDTSWHNDVTASSTRVEKTKSGLELVVFVHPARRSARELPTYPRFSILLYNTAGDAVEMREASTADGCQKAITELAEI